MNASILAIGTEITSGQINNSHAPWIAKQIEDLGISTIRSVAVPDDHELILEALDFAKSETQFLFITGGLGPTKDDFTRNVIADWLDCELEFDEKIWSELQQRLKDRNVVISSNHKNQCFFPEGSRILKNSVGTAHGFYLEYDDTHIWILPGPTPELRSIWVDHVLPQLAQLTEGKKFVVKKWRCLGAPESELADLTESLLEGSHFQTGYRLDTPCVEVKVWIPTNQLKNAQTQWLTKIDSAFQEWLISKDEENIAFAFLEKTLSVGPLILIDDASQGQLSEKLMSIVRDKKFPHEFRALSSSIADLGEISFEGSGATVRVLATAEPLSWKIEIKSSSINKTETISFKSKSKINPDRVGKIIAELALKKLVGWFN